jgi:putative CocE/NonD family hydrolase
MKISHRRSNNPVIGSTRLSSLVTLLLMLSVSGCGGSGADPGATGIPSKTELSGRADAGSPENEREAPASDNTPAYAAQNYQAPLYYRDPAYPKVKNLPLQFITTAKGKKLSVRVTVPADETGKPVDATFHAVLVQSGYNTNLMSQIFMGTPGNAMLGVTDPFLVRRGYVQVSVDALGTGASEGSWELFGEDEQAAFADAVDWIPQQPWSNGKIGAAGISYMAISALFAAQRRPDAIQAVFASLPMGDPMRGTVNTGGLINGVFMSTWMTITQTLSTQNVSTALLNPRYIQQLTRTTQEHIDTLESYHLPLIDGTLNGSPETTFDGPFWRLRSPLENIDRIKAPTMILGTVDDIFQRDQALLYEALKKNNVDTRLIIYPGTHVGNFITQHIGNEAVLPVDFLLLQWFDKYLLGMDTGTEKIPPVLQSVKNYPTVDTPERFRADTFASTTDWPHPLATPERWYLRGDGRLTKQAPLSIEPFRFMTEPEPPVGSARAANGLLVFDVNINDGTECSRSYQVWTLGLTLPKSCFTNADRSPQQKVIYESEPMADDYYINGPIQADIWIESTVTEAVVSVEINEVSDARAKPLTSGQLLASVREVDEGRSRFLKGQMIQPYHYFTQEKSKPLVPGEVVKMSVEIFPTSAIIRKGNRLRVAISPSNQAQGMLNYPRQAATAGGITRLHNSPQYPSSVVFPVVPVSALN